MQEQEERNYEEMSTDELEQELDKALSDDSTDIETDKGETKETTENLEQETEEEDTEEENNEPEKFSDEESFDKRFEGKSKEEVERAYFELQKKLGEQGAELGELRKQLQELQQLKEKLATMDEAEKKEPEHESEESFDPEQWQELLATDPEAAAQYYYEKFVLPQQRAMEQKRLEEQKQAEMAKKQQELLTRQVEAFEKFANEAKDELGLNEDELNDFANFLAKYSKPDPEKGFYDVNDLKKRYFWYNPEKLKASAAKQMLETVEEQAPKVKTLGGVQNAKTKTTDPFKDVHDIVEAEKIAESYSPEDLDRLLDELEE